MKLYIPLDKYFITQRYAENGNTYYKEAGRKGHGAYDLVATGADKTVYASCDGYIYSHINKDNPDLMAYRGVYMLVEDGGQFYEQSWGHFDKIYVEPGMYVKKGTPLGTEGNTGQVAAGGKKVTAEMKNLYPRIGAHVHWQLRECVPVEKRKTGKKYLKDSQGYFKKDDSYFEILNYENGYAGCIDPTPFIVMESAKPKGIVDTVINAFIPEKRITSTLRYKMKHEQVKILQKLLNRKRFSVAKWGAGSPGYESDYFGEKTRAAVKEFQKSTGLKADGVVGPLTTKKLYE